MEAINLLKQTTEYEVLQSFRDKVSKLEQERSYSEEDLRNAFFSFPDEWICFEEWFERFKKK